jgi:hypothetical protein
MIRNSGPDEMRWWDFDEPSNGEAGWRPKKNAGADFAKRKVTCCGRAIGSRCNQKIQVQHVLIYFRQNQYPDGRVIVLPTHPECNFEVCKIGP